MAKLETKFLYSSCIAEILSAADRKLERVKKGLMNELLTGRKRVKV
jgi:hypothetical protein